jgi:hypothetical protein
MSHNMASWRSLDEMMIELRKKGVVIPANIIEDLRAAKSMLQLSCLKGSGDAVMKAEELMANVEAYVMTEGQTVFGEAYVQDWLRRLEEASAQTGEESIDEDKFVTGVPRDQKWVRIEPNVDLTSEKVAALAAEFKLQIKPKKDGKLLVHGQPENLKAFFKKMTAEQNSKKCSQH